LNGISCGFRVHPEKHQKEGNIVSVCRTENLV